MDQLILIFKKYIYLEIKVKKRLKFKIKNIYKNGKMTWKFQSLKREKNLNF